MTKQITLEEVLEMVSFKKNAFGEWRLVNVNCNVNGNIHGDVDGTVCGDVDGSVLGNIYYGVAGDIRGDVDGDIYGNVLGTVKGDIYCDEWQRVETPKQKLKRFIKETGNSEMLELLEQL